MFIGKKLTPTSTIGIIAPSGCSNDSTIDSYISEFKKLNFNVCYNKSLYQKYGYLAGCDIDRANDLMEMFKDPKIDGIICFRGGFGAIRMLPYLDIKSIQKNAKFFCGYSDITLLLNYFAQNKIPTFHGPLIKSDFTKDSKTLPILKYLMQNPSKGFTYDFKENFVINNKSATGILMGGNLSTICSSIGTHYEVNLSSSILLLEEINEAPYVVDRLISQLLLCKTISKCRAILLGHFTNCNSNQLDNFDIRELLISKLKKLNIPIIFDIPFGHDYPNYTFPLGIRAHYSSNTKKLHLTENALL